MPSILRMILLVCFVGFPAAGAGAGWYLARRRRGR